MPLLSEEIRLALENGKRASFERAMLESYVEDSRSELEERYGGKEIMVVYAPGQGPEVAAAYSMETYEDILFTHPVPMMTEASRANQMQAFGVIREEYGGDPSVTIDTFRF